MGKKWIKLVSFAMAGILSIGLAACSSSNSESTPAATTGSESSAISEGVDYTQGESYTFIFGTDGAEDTVNGLVVNYMVDQLNELTGGRIVVQKYFNGSMGTDTELCEATQAGDVTFFNGSTAFTANFVTELSAVDLPFLYSNAAQFRATMDEPEVQEFYNERYNENGFVLLGFYDQGMRQMTSNKKIQSIEDIAGQKIRVMENELHIAIWNALGANPTPMAFSEVYMALQQGTIDAQENPFEVIYANKLYEQQKYIIMTNHLPASHNLLISKTIFDSLSATDQELILLVGAAAIQYAREQCDSRLSERMDLVTTAGSEIVTLEDSVLVEMQEKCESVYDTARQKYGDAQVDMQIQAAEKNKK